MKISSVQNYSNISFSPKTQKAQTFQQNPVVQHNFAPSFSGGFPLNVHSPKYFAAKTYLCMAKQAYKKVKTLDLYMFDLNKLDGIQEGINVFKGLNMKEIAFVADTVAEITVNRGCRNICAHCYASAKAPIKETANQINKMSWNDFTSLTDGFEELNKRVGFSIFSQKSNKHAMIIPFHDADCSSIVLKDNDGKEHDFIDIAEKFEKVFNLPILFDTAGWNIQDVKAQKRMEKYVEYYSKPENFKKLEGFNLSVNPFHAMYAKSLELKQNRKPELAEKLYDLYTTRMANVLYTLTPLQENPRFNFIARSAADKSKLPKGFKSKDLRALYMDILEKVNNLYKKDIKGEQKIVKNEDEAFKCFSDYYERLGDISKTISVSERASKIVPDNDVMAIADKEMRNRSLQDIQNIKRVRDFRKINKDMNRHFYGIVDANGDYYLTTFRTSFPTEIKFNFENKGKSTVPIAPYLQKDTPLTRNVINNV